MPAKPIRFRVPTPSIEELQPGRHAIFNVGALATIHAAVNKSDGRVETGGWLVGPKGAGSTEIASRPDPGDRARWNHFELAELDLDDEFRLHDLGLEVIGCWHSHAPGSPPVLSNVDVTTCGKIMAALDRTSLLAALVTSDRHFTEANLAAWRMTLPIGGGIHMERVEPVLSPFDAYRRPRKPSSAPQRRSSNATRVTPRSTQSNPSPRLARVMAEHGRSGNGNGKRTAR